MKKKQTKKAVAVPGFRFSGITAGIKKSRKKDIALISSDNEAVIAGVYTTNRIKAAPVLLSMSRIRRNRKCKAILINSGNANACTGQQGMQDAREMARLTAKELGTSPHLVYVSSTGVIGKPLPMQKIRKAIPDATKNLSPHAFREAASAIMTTDTFPKIACKQVTIAGKKGTIAGIAKGAGMICPSMATMLSFIVTDIAVQPAALDALLRDTVNRSFNRLTIDNDMSTNDTVLMLANGFLGNKPIGGKSSFYTIFKKALHEVAYDLSKQIALDGEGATKLIEIVVKGARTESDAERAAKAIAQSLLVKTAVYGQSLNWGRIMAAIGYSGATIREHKITIHLNNCKIVKNGIGVDTGKNIRKLLLKKSIVITVNLGAGKKEAKVLTCDLTEKYIKINADYMT
jgi:glutamate N-acetyltransferase/amino-acid N-acetyltransferase